MILDEFEQINKFANSSEWSKCLEACRHATIKDDHKTLVKHCIVICLLHLSEFEKALHELDEISKDEMHFERSYALYKLKRYKEALQFCTDDNRGLLLKSQIMYCNRNHKEVDMILTNIINEKECDEDLMTNYIANLIQLGTLKLPFDDQQASEINETSNVELLSNYILFLFNMDKISCANDSLRSSEAVKDLLMRDNGKDDKKSMIYFLRAISLHLQSKYSEAADVYKKALQISESKNQAHLITTNLFLCNISTSKEKDVDIKFKKRYKKFISKLIPFDKLQEWYHLYNEISIYPGQSCKSNESQLASTCNLPLQKHYYADLKTYLLLRKVQCSEAVPESNLTLYQRAQILATQGLYSQAAVLLESCEDSDNLAIVICDLYLKSNDIDSIKRFLNSLLDKSNDQVITKLSRYLIRHNLIRNDEELLGKLKSIVQLPTLNELCNGMTLNEVEITLGLTNVSLNKSKKKYRKRKNKPAKNMDKPLDHERWIALKDRSYFKSSRRRAKQQAKKTMQGGPMSEVGVECEHWTGDKTNKSQGKIEALATSTVKKPSGSGTVGNKSIRSKRKRKDKW